MDDKGYPFALEAFEKIWQEGLAQEKWKDDESVKKEMYDWFITGWNLSEKDMIAYLNKKVTEASPTWKGVDADEFVAFVRGEEVGDHTLNEESSNETIYLPFGCNASVEGNKVNIQIKGPVSYNLKQSIARQTLILAAKSHKQVILIGETNGTLQLYWDTRSAQDVKELLQFALERIDTPNN